MIIRHPCSIFYEIITEQLSYIGSDISTDFNHAHLLSLKKSKNVNIYFHQFHLLYIYLDL